MLMFNRRSAALALIGASFGLMQTAPALAQAWPSRPVTMVVPFTAGTTSDVIARSLAQELHQKLGQPFIIENKGGAGGNIGAMNVARANADGYTILFATTLFVLLFFLHPSPLLDGAEAAAAVLFSG